VKIIDVIDKKWSSGIYISWWLGVFACLFNTTIALIIFLVVPFAVWHRPLIKFILKEWKNTVKMMDKTVKKK